MKNKLRPRLASRAGLPEKLPAKRPFLSDIQTLRDRARQHMEKGAVTEGYRADRETVIRILNEALATEIVCVLRYKRHYFMASGIHAQAVAQEFLEHANEEQAHAAGREAIAAIEESRWKMFFGNTAALLLTALLGYLTFRRIVRPVRALDEAAGPAIVSLRLRIEDEKISEAEWVINRRGDPGLGPGAVVQANCSGRSSPSPDR